VRFCRRVSPTRAPRRRKAAKRLFFVRRGSSSTRRHLSMGHSVCLKCLVPDGTDLRSPTEARKRDKCVLLGRVPSTSWRVNAQLFTARSPSTSTRDLDRQRSKSLEAKEHKPGNAKTFQCLLITVPSHFVALSPSLA
jgi:hypothetical protein